MKKVIAVLAVLAVAAAAQAELLNTWSFGGGETINMTKNTSAANAGQVTFGTLSRVNGLTSASTQANAFCANNFTAADNAGFAFTLDVADEYEVANSVIDINGVNGNNSGPAALQWYLYNNSTVGSALGNPWASQTAAGSAKTTGDATFTIGAGNNTLLLKPASDASINGGTIASAGRANLRGEMRFDGDIREASAVPEPATMSLLGLGALAMALRRKLRK